MKPTGGIWEPGEWLCLLDSLGSNWEADVDQFFKTDPLPSPHYDQSMCLMQKIWVTIGLRHKHTHTRKSPVFLVVRQEKEKQKTQTQKIEIAYISFWCCFKIYVYFWMRLYCTICFTPFASLSALGKSWFLVSKVLCHWPHDPAEAGWAQGPGSPWQKGTDQLHLIPQERVSNRLTLRNVLYKSLLPPAGQFQTQLAMF